MKKLLAFILLAAAILLCACSHGENPVAVTNPTPRVTDSMETTENYSQIYEIISPYLREGGWRYDGFAFNGVKMEMAEAEDLAVPGASATGAADYSETNVQVSGVDEGDIVKTDGEYIYAIKNGEFIIFDAAGTETSVISRTNLATDKENYTREPFELYVSGDRAAVIYGEYYYKHQEVLLWSNYESSETAMVDIYDISDKAAPVPVKTLGQDGYFSTSRLIGDTLYIISNHYVNEGTEDEPESFIPCKYENGEAELAASSDVFILPYVRTANYTVISACSMETGDITANLSVLGGNCTVYMNTENLYLANSYYFSEESEPRSEPPYVVTDHYSYNRTDIARISLSGGGLSLEATGSVRGNPVNQFALDEYNGHLRIVTTDFYDFHTSYEDTEKGFYNNKFHEDSRSNNLYVLDMGLNTVGSIEGLAEDEMVYSVRYDGDIAYFVTFRQTDPLFTADLSDPAKPVILSALKIPGFSEYLHVYGEGRLFGLGMDADENTGITGGMKLSMFDTTDKTDVTEKHKLILDYGYSEALYNHKAILISPEKDIIAFPAENGYAVYGYSDEAGFYERAKISAADGEEYYWNGDARGLYIGDFAYVLLQNRLMVLDLQELSLAEILEF